MDTRTMEFRHLFIFSQCSCPLLTLFWRPPAGIGLCSTSVAAIRSARMLLDEINIFECSPNDDIILDKKGYEAFAVSNPKVEIAVYFPEKAEIALDTSLMKGNLEIKWLDAGFSKWSQPQHTANTGKLILKTPFEGNQVAVVSANAV
jgi:hypothetical protein